MTTLLSTPEFILADRALMMHDFDIKIDHQKLFKSKDNKVVLAMGGNVGFEYPKGLTDILINNLALITDAEFGKEFKNDSGAMKVLNGLTDNALNQIKDFANNGILILHTPHNRYYFDGSCNKTPKVVGSKGCIEYGSGGQLALTLYYLGYSAEEIAAAIPELDEYSSNKFDIIYTKDLNK